MHWTSVRYYEMGVRIKKTIIHNTEKNLNNGYFFSWIYISICMYKNYFNQAFVYVYRYFSFFKGKKIVRIIFLYVH